MIRSDETRETSSASELPAPPFLPSAMPASTFEILPDTESDIDAYLATGGFPVGEIHAREYGK